MIAITDNVVGANAERSRTHNRQMVLGQIRLAGQTGRADIARVSGLSIQAVSNITSDLLSEGMILEKGRRTAGRGQPPVLYSLNPGGGFALGVEVRPDAVFAAVLDLCGNSLASERRTLASTEQAMIGETLLALKDDILRRLGIPDARILGAGIVMPGPFGETGIHGEGSDLPGWEDTSPADWFAALLGVPVLVENDANAAAIAERVSGVAQDLDTYAYLYFGRGLGLGIVQNGRLIKGAFGNAGEIGHIQVPTREGAVVLESMVSRVSVQRALASRGVQVTSGEDLTDLYAGGDGTLMAWLDDAVEPLSAAVTITENLLDPQTVILGGAMPDVILDHLVTAVKLSDRSVSKRGERALPRLMRGASGRLTATLGAAALVINQAFTPKISVQTREL